MADLAPNIFKSSSTSFHELAASNRMRATGDCFSFPARRLETISLVAKLTGKTIATFVRAATQCWVKPVVERTGKCSAYSSPELLAS